MWSLLEAWRRFVDQPCRRYRNFQVVFTVLTLNFAIPALIYAVAPEVAHEQFVRLNQWLGGAPYTFPEAGSRFWRYLGTANVATLAFMCLLLQLDLRRRRIVLVPLVFLKGTAATLWLLGYLGAPQFPALLAAAVLDYVTCGAFLHFATTAAREIAGQPDDVLVPRPDGADLVG